VMFSNTQQSLNDLGMLWVLIPGTILKPLLIVLFHQSLLMVSLMSDVAIGALFVGMAIRYVMEERQMERAFRAVAAAAITATAVSSTSTHVENGDLEIGDVGTASGDPDDAAIPTRWPDRVAPSPAAELAAEAHTANGHSGSQFDADSAEPQSDVAAMTSLDPRELVDGLLDRWERTLAQRIHAEGRQRFEAELSARQDLVKQLQLELQLIRADHAAVQAEKDLRLDQSDRRVHDLETRTLAPDAPAPKRRRWIFSR
jgi:hypothetical protein